MKPFLLHVIYNHAPHSLICCPKYLPFAPLGTGQTKGQCLDPAISAPCGAPAYIYRELRPLSSID